MLETIDARCTLARPPHGVERWHFRRSASGAKTWSHPETPDGVSLLTVSQTPSGEIRARMEGNLTTLYTGDKHAAIASLTRQEVPGAIAAFHGVADTLLERTPVPEPHWWDVHRLDPSRTYLVPSEVTVAGVVDAAARAWGITRRKDSVLTRHNDETVTLRLAKHRTWTIYNKAAEAAQKGNPYVRPEWGGVVRLEARLRPRADKSDARKDWNPRLDLTNGDLDVAQEETDALAEVLTKMTASTLLGSVHAFMRAGATPNEAMRLTTVAQLRAGFGDQVFEELGVPLRTAQRWRSEVQHFVSAMSEESLEAETFPEVLRIAQELHLSDILGEES